MEERAAALTQQREVEYLVKKQVSSFFGIGYTEVAFAGSAQLGFSVHKNRLFRRGMSDLDVALVSPALFQQAWMNVIDATSAFTDETKFSGLNSAEIEAFKSAILRRGMIRVELMPKSELSIAWRSFEDQVGRRYAAHFKSISFAIYLNEYAFCWKQDSAISSMLRS